jgi:hypothetical protein
VHGVHVVDEELDDDGVVAGRPGAPGANSGTVRVLAIASVAKLVLSSAKFSFDRLAWMPVARS